MGDLAKKLSEAAGGGLRMSDFDGQTLEVLSIEKSPSPFEKGAISVTVTALTSEGEEVSFYATPTSGNQLIAIEEDLPASLRVVSFPGQFGKTGYLFEEAE